MKNLAGKCSPIALSLLFLGGNVSLMGCRQLSEKKEDTEEPVGASAPTPASVAIGSSTKSNANDSNGSNGNNHGLVIVAVDPITGLLKSGLVLRLDYVPASKPGQTSLPICAAAFASDVKVGAVDCVEGIDSDQVSTAKPLLAGQVVQECRAQAAKAQDIPARIEAQAVFTMPGCSEATIKLNLFDPPLRLDAASK